MTILDKFINTIENPNGDLDSELQSSFSDKVSVFKGFSKDIKVYISDSSGNSLNFEPLNKYDWLNNANVALIHLERCMLLDDAHTELKKEVSAVIEKLIRVKDVEIVKIIQDLELLRKKEPRSSEWINFEKINSIVEDSHSNISNLIRLNEEYSSSVKNLDHIRKEKDALIVKEYSRPHNDDVIRATLLRRYDVELERRKLKAKVPILEGKVKDLESQLIKYRNLNSESDIKLTIEHLERRLNSEKELFKHVVKTYSSGGALDIEERWDKIRRHFESDFDIARHALEYVNQGWKAILNKGSNVIDIDGNTSLTDMVVKLRQAIYLYKSHFSSYYTTTLIVRIDNDVEDPHRLNLKEHIIINGKKVYVSGVVYAGDCTNSEDVTLKLTINDDTIYLNRIDSSLLGDDGVFCSALNNRRLDGLLSIEFPSGDVNYTGVIIFKVLAER